MTNPTEAPMANAIDDVTGRAADASVAEFVALERAAWTAVESAAEWDDRTSPDGYEDYLFFKPHELHQILVSFFETVAAAPPSPAPSQHTGWSDEAVEALTGIVKAWEATKPGDTTRTEIQRWLIEDMKPAIDIARAALTAESSIAPATGFEVKALEWEDVGDYLAKAKTPFGFSYFVNHRTNMWIGQDDDWAVAEGDPTDAAQANFDRRIRSSISPSVAKESGEP